MKGEFCAFIASLLSTKPNKGIWKLPGWDSWRREWGEEKKKKERMIEYYRWEQRTQAIPSGLYSDHISITLE